jgi:hypothetical protein
MNNEERSFFKKIQRVKLTDTSGVMDPIDHLHEINFNSIISVMMDLNIVHLSSSKNHTTIQRWTTSIDRRVQSNQLVGAAI